MLSKTWHTWAKVGLIAMALFFACRELGTFPAAWEDDSIFMLVARMVAEGRGYVLPILGHDWQFPYVLGVGPTVILPSSFFMWLFGFSIEAARVSAGAYLLGSVVLMWSLTKKNIDETSAIVATALLISLSAYVNTGKIVMGEIPALFFLLAGLLVWNRPMISGVLLGLSAMTKLTFGIVYPALGVCIVIALLKRNWRDARKLLIQTVVALLPLLAWKAFEMGNDSAILAFILERIGGGHHPPLRLLAENPNQLLRLPFLYFDTMLVFGALGMWKTRHKMPASLLPFCASFIGIVIVYFLSNEGWYRHILPAHVLLLPFVYAGMRSIASKTIVTLLCIFFVGSQGWWQFTHKGSSASTEAEEAARILHEQYADMKMIIRHSEIFVRYPGNPNWLFLPLPEITSYSPKQLTQKTEDMRCMPELWKKSTGEHAAYGNRLTQVHKRFVLITPEADCS